MATEQHEPKQEETTVADDPKAREMLRQAFEKTARWQKDFKGFTADLTVNVKDRKSTRLNSSHIQKSRMPSSA